MPRVIFVEADGTEHSVVAKAGISLMEAARNESIPGIDAICGGCCACATCHVYVRLEWQACTGSPSDEEREMLEFASDPRQESRLSCQMIVTESMDGLVVDMPEDQGA